MPPPYCYEHPRPAVTVDLVAFTTIEGTIHVLLIRRKHEPFAGSWALPGGFLEIDEPVESAARRELLEETGLELAGPLEPIGCFTRPGRDPRGRTITLAFATALPPGPHPVAGRDDAAEAAWIPLDQPLELAFDHAEILDSARAWLRRRVQEGPVGLLLLGPTPPPNLPQVQRLFRQLGLPPRSAGPWLRRMARIGQLHPSAPPGQRDPATS